MSKRENWSLILGNGTLCRFSRMTNTLQSSNNLKVWNSEGNNRFRTQAVRDHFNQIGDVETMYGGAKLIEKIRWRTYFVENKNKEGSLSSSFNEKVTSVLYWLCEEEVAHCKINSLLKLAESFGIVEMATFKKWSNRVLKELLLILGSQVKENLLKRIKRSSYFGILTTRLLILQISM